MLGNKNEHEKKVFNSYLKILEGSIIHTLSKEKTIKYKLENIQKEDAVCVLLYHQIRKSIILISQYRYAIDDKT